MFCSYCGQPLSEDMTFCVRCGRPVEVPEEEVLPLEFDDAPETTGPLPRVDEEGNPLQEGEGADEGAVTVAEVAAEADGAVEAEAAAAETVPPGPSQAQQLAALVKPAGMRPLAADAPVVRVHKSRVPMIIGFVLIAVVIGCACFVGGLYAATEGVFGPADDEPSPMPSQPTVASATNTTGGATQGADTQDQDAAQSAAAVPEDTNGAATADEVAKAVQEGWEMLMANEFSEDAQQQWTQQVLSLQPAGMLEALAALVGVDGDSLLPLYLYDAAPLESQLPIDEFLNGRQGVVATNQEPVTTTELAALTVYFGDLGQTVSGQVPRVNLPFNIDEAFRLEMDVAPMNEESEAEKPLAINEGGQSYVVYRYENRWYLFAPLLQKADV